MRVQILAESVINQIAAGEVVERPASVMKELVENALDAEATRIEIEAQAGGLTSIRVTDNGIGMSQADLELAVERHATSKIQDASDLFHVSTLGFRGEALPSIASVAKLKIATRERGSLHGSELVVCGGKKEDVQPVGMPEGTTVVMEALFFNTPARRKFMKGAGTEFHQLTKLLAQYIVAYPQVAFRFLHEGKVILNASGNGNLVDAVAAAFDPNWQAMLIPLDFSHQGVTITGLIGKPTFTRSTRQCQIFVVNGRLVKHFLFTKILEEGYRTLIPTGKYPVAVLSLRLPLPTVDVNVHPTKREIRLAQQEEILRYLDRALKQVLYRDVEREIDQVMAPPALAMRTSARAEGEVLAERLLASPPIAVLATRPAEAMEVVGEEPWLASPLLFSDQDGKSQLVYPEVAEARAGEEIDFSTFSPLAQLALTYIVATNGKDLLVMDQHAAHERILYENLRKQRTLKGEIESQLMLTPTVIELPPTLASAYGPLQDLLTTSGFHLEPFGERTYLIRAVPAPLVKQDPEQMVVNLLETLSIFGVMSELALSLERVDKFVACRGAVMAGDPLTQPEMEHLLKMLPTVPACSVCPHGRPTYVLYKEMDLAKWFHRR